MNFRRGTCCTFQTALLTRTWSTRPISISRRLDLRVDQEIPLFVDGLKARAFFKIYNFSNLLNDDWGRQYDARFDSSSVVTVTGLDAQGAYEYDSFRAGNKSITTLQNTASVWEIRLGVDVSFR